MSVNLVTVYGLQNSFKPQMISDNTIEILYELEEYSILESIEDIYKNLQIDVEVDKLVDNNENFECR